MPKPKNRTSRLRVQPEGVAKRLADAPPTRYVHGRTGSVRPEGSDTYTLDGVTHRFDGACHDDCENVR